MKGETMSVEIAGIGTLTNPVVLEPEGRRRATLQKEQGK